MQIPIECLGLSILPGTARFIVMLPDVEFEELPGPIVKGGKFRGRNEEFVLPTSSIPVGTILCNGLAKYRVVTPITSFMYVLEFVGDDGRWPDLSDPDLYFSSDYNDPVASILPGFAQFVEVDKEATAEFLAPLKRTGFAYIPKDIGGVVPC